MIALQNQSLSQRSTNTSSRLDSDSGVLSDTSLQPFAQIEGSSQLIKLN